MSEIETTLPQQNDNLYLIFWPELLVEHMHSYWGTTKHWRCCNPDEIENTIIMEKQGKYVVFGKQDEPNRYFRYNLQTKSCERINIYKTTGTKISPVSIENMRPWFAKCEIKTADPLFARMFLWTTHHHHFSDFKNGARFVEGFGRGEATKIEKWYNIGVKITQVENLFKSATKNKHAVGSKGGGYGMYTRIDYIPSDFTKRQIKLIKDYDEINLKDLNDIHYLDDQKFVIYNELRKAAENPMYEEAFYMGENLRDYLFDSDDYTMRVARDRLIDVMAEFNLEVDALCRFLSRLQRVEGCDIIDLTDGFHYRDYLRMEKTLNDESLSKMDKYPQNWLTTFRRTKRNYEKIRQRIDRSKFDEQVEAHRNLVYKNQRHKYEIVLPESPQDIRNEGTVLKHCVASYVPKVTNGDTFIIFCRHKDALDEPLVTIEVRKGKITQAYGKNDSKPTEEALAFIRRWAKAKTLELSWRWD